MKASVQHFLNNRIFVAIWDIIITLAALYLAAVVPFQLAMGYWKDGLPLEQTLFITVLFLLDILFNIYETSRESAAFSIYRISNPKNYFRTWFFFDLIAVIPFGVFFHPICQLSRLAKLVKVNQILEEWRLSNLRYAQTLRLLYLMAVVLLATHWLSCGWMVIRGMDPELSLPDNYINSLYWSVTTVTTVGYGDITPANTLEKLYAIFTMLTGLGFFGFLIGNVTRLIYTKDPAREHYLENLDQLSNIVRYRYLPPELQAKIYDYFTYKWQKRIGYDEEKFLEGLPPNLKKEVALYLKQEILTGVPLFACATPDFYTAIALRLRQFILTPGDCAFKAGERGDRMYFLIHGIMQVIAPDGKKILGKIKDGDFFGEIALFKNIPRSASVIAESYCDLYYLSKQDFDEVMSKYPQFATEIEKAVEERVGID